jgi:hypothetical protein
MTIPCNKNITKQLNNYSYVIAITLQGLLQRTKRALNVLSSVTRKTLGYSHYPNKTRGTHHNVESSISSIP